MGFKEELGVGGAHVHVRGDPEKHSKREAGVSYSNNELIKTLVLGIGSIEIAESMLLRESAEATGSAQATPRVAWERELGVLRVYMSALYRQTSYSITSLVVSSKRLEFLQIMTRISRQLSPKNQTQGPTVSIVLASRWVDLGRKHIVPLAIDSDPVKVPIRRWNAHLDGSRKDTIEIGNFVAHASGDLRQECGINASKCPAEKTAGLVRMIIRKFLSRQDTFQVELGIKRFIGWTVEGQIDKHDGNGNK